MQWEDKWEDDTKQFRQSQMMGIKQRRIALDSEKNSCATYLHRCEEEILAERETEDIEILPPVPERCEHVGVHLPVLEVFGVDEHNAIWWTNKANFLTENMFLTGRSERITRRLCDVIQTQRMNIYNADYNHATLINIFIVELNLGMTLEMYLLNDMDIFCSSHNRRDEKTRKA